jgi:primosomal protein N' (replication factor Y)
VSLTAEGRSAAIDGVLARRAPRQVMVLDYLARQPDGQADVDRVLADVGVVATIIDALARRGLVVVEVDRQAAWVEPVAPAAARSLRLTQDQSVVVESICASIEAGGFSPHLVHGVTASGKTEIYLRAIEAALRQGRGALVLVPEIALTPQAVHRYGARFPGQVAVIHSRLSARERDLAWRRIRSGEARVAIGPRSALFAPHHDLGVVVVDEEHEPSYKQSRPPLYHGRAAAEELARLAGATLILGSATPDVVTYERAVRGDIALHSLPRRVTGPTGSSGASSMPTIGVVDLRKSPPLGSEGVFSQPLHDAIAATIAAKDQVLLYLNRRGAAPLVICGACGHVDRCPGCDLPLIYHVTVDRLICHQCFHRAPAADACAACASTRLQYLGAGTQRVVLEIEQSFPGARVLRWDADTMVGRDAVEDMTRQILDRTVDIVVGTQAIAKGLDLPGIALVGVVQADVGLFLPDLRAGERTFQLLTQVAGRAGRGEVPGRVLVQTYVPEHPIIRAALDGDYSGFARRELRIRREHGYPPFGDLARGVYAAADELVARDECATQVEALRRQMRRLGLADTDVIGPTPCFYARIRGRYRWHVVLRGREVASLVRSVTWPAPWIVDIDPVSLL